MTIPRPARLPRSPAARKAQQVWVGVWISAGALAQVVFNLVK